MTDKFTLRDFFVFFLSGLAVFFCVLLTSFNETIDAIKWLSLEKNAIIKAFLKDYSTLIGILSIPLFYFVGQVVHGVDDMFYSSVKFIRQKLKINPKSRSRLNINNIFDCNRINGILERNEVEIEKFWYKFARLQRENIFLTSDYWYIMNELFKGLAITCFAFGFYGLFYGQNAILMFALSIVFWRRANYFAKRFIWNVLKVFATLS